MNNYKLIFLIKKTAQKGGLSLKIIQQLLRFPVPSF